MRKALVAVIALALLTPLAVWAGQKEGRSRVDAQSFGWTTTEQSTASGDWKSVEGLGPVALACAPGGATASLSAVVERGSGPVDFRVRMEDLSVAGEGRPMRPGRATFETGGLAEQGLDSRSITFVAKNVPGTHGSAQQVEWRSPSGTNVTLHKATLRAIWNAASSAFSISLSPARVVERCR
jgi:hypothetical protein